MVWTAAVASPNGGYGGGPKLGGGTGVGALSTLPHFPSSKVAEMAPKTPPKWPKMPLVLPKKWPVKWAKTWL